MLYLKRIALLCLVLSSSFVHSQMLDSMALSLAPTYTNLEEALKDPQKVYKLSLRKNKLKKIPAEITSLKNLQILDLTKNSIKVIPSEIGELKNLQTLNLSRNDIEALPKEIAKLSKLRYLNISRNELSSLPIEIAELMNLETLDLWSNNIDIFPAEMSKMKKLKTLDLRVITMSDPKQKKIQELLPNTKIYFSNSCKCAN